MAIGTEDQKFAEYPRPGKVFKKSEHLAALITGYYWFGRMFVLVVILTLGLFFAPSEQFRVSGPVDFLAKGIIFGLAITGLSFQFIQKLAEGFAMPPKTAYTYGLWILICSPVFATAIPMAILLKMASDRIVAYDVPKKFFWGPSLKDMKATLQRLRGEEASAAAAKKQQDSAEPSVHV